MVALILGALDLHPFLFLAPLSFFLHIEITKPFVVLLLHHNRNKQYHHAQGLIPMELTNIRMW